MSDVQSGEKLNNETFRQPQAQKYAPAETDVSGPYFGIIPRRVAKLRLPGRVHAVLDVIACHANPKRGNRAYLCRDTIANEAGIDCSKVSFCTRWLKKNGVVEISGRGGRGLANVYRIIPDAEAVTPAAATVVAENGADDGIVSGQNGADFGSKTVLILAQNGAIFGTPTEEEQKERTDPPSGEARTRAREEGDDFLNDEVDRRQIEMLFPFNGGGGREHRLAALKTYNPNAETIQFGSDLGINAHDLRVLGKFRDWHIEHNILPANREAIDAAYRNWLRNEQRFADSHNARGPPRRPHRSRLAESALNRATAYDG
jgi:hypothetical protein